MNAIPAIASGIGLIQGIGAQRSAENRANKAMSNQERLLALQERAIAPLLDQAQQYDPAKETERALGAYDAASNESLKRDIGGSTVAQTLLGFAPGQTGDGVGGVKNVLSNRAFQRGQFLANLKLGESGRKADMFARAANAGQGLNSGVQASGNNANMYLNQASQYDPSGSIAAIGSAFKGLKLPWQKSTPDYRRAGLSVRF